ncbi:hypothetical protein ACJX0J_028918, partial [Zea mays]
SLSLILWCFTMGILPILALDNLCDLVIAFQQEDALTTIATLVEDNSVPKLNTLFELLLDEKTFGNNYLDLHFGLPTCIVYMYTIYKWFLPMYIVYIIYEYPKYTL